MSDDLVKRLRDGQRLGCGDCRDTLNEAAARIADLERQLAANTKAHEKEIAVWSENYAALERQLAEAREVEAEVRTLRLQCDKTSQGWAAETVRAEAAEAQAAKLAGALTDLDKAASEVARRGAVTGPQWSRLTIASLKARAALSAAKEYSPTEGTAVFKSVRNKDGQV